MAGQQISSYYAKVGILPDMAQIKKVDAYLKQVEKKLQAFQNRLAKSNLKLVLNLNNFKIDNKKLQTSLGNALDAASSRVTFEVTRFVVNQRNLQAALMRAGRTVSTNISAGVSTRRPSQHTAASGVRSEASLSRANFLHAGGAGGALARYGVESLPFIGGAYGMQQLNQANQNMMSANIAAESVLGPEAKARMDWLSQRANYLGVNYAETLPQFTKFMASASPLLGGDAAQETFSSFLQFGRTRGATSVSMNRALNAVAQMAAKGQIMQEELKGQLAEASGFGELPQLFAEAYQIKTGGSLKGADARAALMKAMEDGLVKSDILPLVASLMNELSKGGIEKARTSSIAEQERAMNALTGRYGLLQTFSEAGGEEGFARFWRETSKIFQEMKPLVQGLAGAFNDLTQVMQPIRTVFEGWNNILETTSELTGLSSTRLVEFAAVGGLMMSKWGRVAGMFTAILLVLEDVAFAVQGKDSLTKRFSEWMQDSGMPKFASDALAVGAALSAIAAALKLISTNSGLPGVGDILGTGKGKTGGVGKGGSGWGSKIIPTTKALLPLAVAGGVVAAAGSVGGEDSAWNRMDSLSNLRQMGTNPLSPFYENPQLRSTINSEMHNPSSSYYGRDPAEIEAWLAQNARQNTIDRMLTNQQNYGNMLPGVLKMEVSVEANITAENAEDFAQKFEGKLNDHLKNTLLNFGYTGGNN